MGKEKINYGKLVRDKIPKRIEESGGSCEVSQLSDDEFRKELVKKVGEEASGVTQARGKKELISEIGDLLDVVDQIVRVFEISSQQIERSRKKEFKRKGGFDKKLFLVWAEDTGYKSNEKKGEGE